MVGLRGAWVAVLSAVLCAGVLVACDDDPEPKVGDPTTAPPSTSSSAPTSPSTSTPTSTGPAEPAMPSAAAENSDAGAEAFVHWWVDLINYGSATGHAETLQSVMDSRCSGCDGIVRAITEPYANGGRIEGGEWVIGSLRPLPLDYGADWAGGAESRTKPEVVFDGAGAATKYPGGKFYLYAYVSWTGSRWSMRWVRTPSAAS